MERIIHPNTTKEYPQCVKNFWKFARFYSSEKLIDIFRGSNGCNIQAPHKNTLKTWNKGLLYGHLYTEESIEKLTKEFTSKKNQTSFSLISWDIVTVRSLLTCVKGNIFGFENGPKSFLELLQLEIDNIDLCGKVVVFELIDTAGYFSLPVAAFNLPGKNAQAEVLKYLQEITQKWNRNDIEIVGSCADGEFKIDTVENYMKQYYTEWYHVDANKDLYPLKQVSRLNHLKGETVPEL
ncbi:predicted protein [Naegleria gruberi]|uniref:Predicted protein n=1 Tax=Naegleria gruberi TaxID=5762 RepID=D2VMI1_NAEGR|nr:uncharacterized protein NAEGRDRAFT_70144 [Naegleria gruberi]EFC42066.1 predicted protein [Naegleria gruberi]|eukprot:XP_002674810.1 predicted protein [Naegleria gruberi strain NEG-M]